MTFRTFRHDFFAMDNSALFIKTFDNNELLWKIQRLFHSIVRVWRKYQTKTNNIHSLLMMITQKCLWLNSWSLDELPISNKKNNWSARTQTSSLENCSVSKLTKTPTNQASGTQNILVWVSFSLNNWINSCRNCLFKIFFGFSLLKKFRRINFTFTWNLREIHFRHSFFLA